MGRGERIGTGAEAYEGATSGDTRPDDRNHWRSIKCICKKSNIQLTTKIRAEHVDLKNVLNFSFFLSR